MARKIRICKEPGCHNQQVTKGHCRLHYLKNWNEIKKVEKRRAAKNLNHYIDDICKKFPDRYLDVLKKDIESEGEAAEVKTEEDTCDSLYYDEDLEGIFDDFNYDKNFDKLLDNLKYEDDY